MSGQYTEPAHDDAALAIPPNEDDRNESGETLERDDEVDLVKKFDRDWDDLGKLTLLCELV